MQDLPHHYAVTAKVVGQGNVTLTSPGLQPIESAGPAEFGGPGNLWSPETFLVAAVADCYILSFRAIARAAKLEWLSLQSVVDGVLDRPDKALQFTEFRLRVTLEVPQGGNVERAMRLLEKAEHSCLITNSMKAETHLVSEVKVVD